MPLSPLLLTVETAKEQQPEKQPFVFRMMQQPAESRRYQLFPKDKQTAAQQVKGLDPEQAFAVAMGHNNGEKADKPCGSGGLRLRIMEHNLNLVRRRKVSVPELSPMTTVHEVAIDSPTIPGRLPYNHERSISAPGHGWKQHHLANMIISPEMGHNHERRTSPVDPAIDSLRSATATRQPLSPKDLQPLVIPSFTSTAPRLTKQHSLRRIRSRSPHHEPAVRPARGDDSPRSRVPYTPTPLSAPYSSHTPQSSVSTFSTTNSTTSTLPTPVSGMTESRASPRLWTSQSHNDMTETPKDMDFDVHNASVPKTATEPRAAPNVLNHRRNQSESSTVGSIMERGRPKKRGENAGPKRTGSKRSKSAERRAFEELPKGWKVTDAVSMLDSTEAAALQKQALQQAARFEILRKEDVDGLSRELRHLDERTEYLRRTYQSLRAGRRNLHARICQYLRSPRTAKFGHDSMLKQEEALAELDSSIDDWVNKLEQAENRRTRVRQKLLEHVAAAATLPLSGSVVDMNESWRKAMGVTTPTVLVNVSTPPRSPSKTAFTPSTSPPPHRVVAPVPSAVVEEVAPVGLGIEEKSESEEPLTAAIRRADVESIRIYAGDDVYKLFAEVETQITRMSKAGGLLSGSHKEQTTPKHNDKDDMSDEDRVRLHRAHSHELLNGAASSPSLATINNHSPVTTTDKTSITSSPRSASPAVPATEAKEDSGEGLILLTSAVFKP